MRCHLINQGLVLVFVWNLLSQMLSAEDLPESGIFRGYYHRDRLGVGYFNQLYVAPELHEKLAPFEGKYIRLDVTNAIQPVNPVNAIIVAIGRIEELPQPQFRFTIKTKPSPMIRGQAFQVIAILSDTRSPNADRNPVGIIPESIQLHVCQPRDFFDEDANRPSTWFREYTNRQLAIDRNGGQVGVSAGPFQNRRANLWINCGLVELKPGDSWIEVVSFPVGVARVDAEVHATANYLIAGELPTEQGRTVTPIETWQKVHVRPATVAGPPTAKDSGVLRIENIKLVSIAEGGWSRMQFALLPISGKRIRVPGAVERSSGEICIDRYANIGRLEAFAADGTQVELEVRREPDADPPNSVRQQLVELPQNGAIITARFCKQSRFAPAIIRLTANFVTEEGVDILNVSDNYRDLDTTPMTPFGSITDGVKIRVRPIRTTFKPGMALTFCFQAVNVSGKPICWRCSDRGYGGNAIVEVDGQAVSLPELKPEYIHGWAGDWICKNPCEWTVTLPETISFSKGRHVLSYSIVSRGGTYLNAHQKAIPLVNGRIISNETSFSVE